jgi:hypothetical protein
LQHLDLELSEGFELLLEAGDELSDLKNLRSLTISGKSLPARGVGWSPRNDGFCPHCDNNNAWLKPLPFTSPVICGDWSYFVLKLGVLHTAHALHQFDCQGRP